MSGQEEAIVPYAIGEADKLYSKHMHVSVAVWQTWRVREDCAKTEAGLETSEEDATSFPDLATLDEMILNSETKIQANIRDGYSAKKIKERREDLVRLKRVEQLYV